MLLPALPATGSRKAIRLCVGAFDSRLPNTQSNMMAKLFGANWRTSVSGIGAGLFGLLTMIAALPYEMGDVATIFPPQWKAKIATAAALATLALKWWNAIVQKDKQTTGGTVQQTVNGDVAAAGTQTLVDATVNASIQSGVPVTAAQRQAVRNT